MAIRVYFNRFVFLFLFQLTGQIGYSQLDSIISRIKINSDFRFRVEQDWYSRKPDGNYRNDRTRLRYRIRTGITYKHQWYETGFRIRTGDPRKQQDPQLTLGEGFKEFGTLPIGFEKAYFKGKLKGFEFWLGKNDFPFRKTNELFWSDNVYPEGVALSKSFQFDEKAVLDSIDIKAAHFIINASGKGLDQDNYMQGFQIYTSLLNKRLEFFPSFYYFNNVPNIPDGAETFRIDYAIAHIGSTLGILKSGKLKLEADAYFNLSNYNNNDSIATAFKDEKNGVVVGLSYGELKQKKDWLFKATYAYLQQYSIVDIMAQNDWARWDYSAHNSPDGRLSNFNGVELVLAYKLEKNINLKAKYYGVEQLVKYGTHLETNQRIRVDIDVKF